MNSGSSYYSVVIQRMSLGSTQIGTRFGNTIIDSGTTYTYMSRQNYRGLTRAIEQYCNMHNSCGAQHTGTCWRIPGGKAGLSAFPDITVTFSGDVATSWEPRSYLYHKGSGDRWCYAFEDDGPNADTVLGASWMLHHDIIFDLTQHKVAIVKANCPEFKQRPPAPTGVTTFLTTTTTTSTTTIQSTTSTTTTTCTTTVTTTTSTTIILVTTHTTTTSTTRPTTKTSTTRPTTPTTTVIATLATVVTTPTTTTVMSDLISLLSTSSKAATTLNTTDLTSDSDDFVTHVKKRAADLSAKYGWATWAGAAGGGALLLCFLCCMCRKCRQ